MFEPVRRYAHQMRRIYYLHADPPETPFVFLINCMCYAGIWPANNAPASSSPSAYYPFTGRAYRLYNHLVYAAISGLTLSMVLDLGRPETLRSARLLADDLTLSTGAAMLWFKTYWFYRHNEAVVRLFVDLERRHRRGALVARASQRQQRARRRYALQDCGILVAWALCIGLLWVAFTTPLWLSADRELMFRAVVPWPTAQSSVGFAVVQACELGITVPALLGIMLLEVCGVWIVNQVGLY